MPQQPQGDGWERPGTGSGATLDTIINEAATKHGIRPDLLRRLVQQESGGNPRAVSPKGARGLGQLMPGTAKELGVNPDNPIENIEGSARYYRQQLDAFGGDETKALAAYNAGPGAVQKYGGVPPYRETQQYVQRIQGGRGGPPPMAPSERGRATAAPAPQTAAPVDDGWIRPDDPRFFSPGQHSRSSMPPVAPVKLGPPPGPPPTIGQGFSPGAALSRLGGAIGANDPASPVGYVADLAGQGLSAAESVLRATPGFIRDRFSSPQAAADTASVALPIVGGVVGGAMGAKKGNWKAASAYAGAGQGVGEAAGMGAQMLAGNPPPTLEEATKRVGTAAASGAVGEGVGRVAIGVGGKLLKPFVDRVSQFGQPIKGSITDTGKEAMTKYPGRFTADQVTEHRGLDIAANVAQGIGGGKYKRFTQATDAFFEETEKARLIRQFTDGDPEKVIPERAGRLWQAARESGVDKFKAQATQKYTQVAEAAGDAKISTASLVDFAKEELAKREAIPGEVTGDTGLRLLRQVVGGMEKEAVEGAGAELGEGTLQILARGDATRPPNPELLQQLMRGGGEEGLPKELSYEQADFFASELKKLIREKADGPGKDDKLVGIAKQLLKRVETEIDTGLPETARTLRREAQAFYKTSKERFDSKLLRDLADKDPEFVVNAITKPGNVTVARAARKATDPATWRRVQALTVQRLLTDKHGGMEGGTKIVEKLSRLTPETMDVVFPSGEAAEVIQVAKILDMAQRNKEGTGKMWIQLTQASALTSLASGGTVGKVARATMVLPWSMATLLTSNLGRKWLTEGFTAPQGSATFTRTVAQAGAWLAAEARRRAQSQAYRESWQDEARDPNAPPGPPQGFGLGNVPAGGAGGTSPFGIRR